MSISEKTAAFMAKHGVTSDEVWLLPGGKAHAIQHSALERIAVANKIEVEWPTVVQNNEHGIALLGAGRIGDVAIWATGEASPKNCKNPYYWAMAEKRLKDRLTLKLLGIHGTGGLYSEDEADDFGDAGERSPPREDAIEKAYTHSINCFVKDRAAAEEFYKLNKGMIQQLRVATRERVLGLLKTISEKSDREAA